MDFDSDIELQRSINLAQKQDRYKQITKFVDDHGEHALGLSEEQVLKIDRIAYGEYCRLDNKLITNPHRHTDFLQYIWRHRLVNYFAGFVIALAIGFMVDVESDRDNKYNGLIVLGIGTLSGCIVTEVFCRRKQSAYQKIRIQTRNKYIDDHDILG